jgi:hypothetical protein
MMRQHILTTALAAAVSALAFGQNLNPTVEVTNAYEGGASSISKPAQQMAVPDSVTRFNLDFDYSVFEKPFKGAYEFRPYYVQLKPEPKASTEEKFYLRAGAGFTLHPELDVVWSPVRKDKFRLNLYATHHSYFGRYHNFKLGDAEDGVFPLVKSGEKMKGFLKDSKVGIDGTFAWDGGVASLDVAYLHRMADIDWHYQKMGGVEVNGRVRSLDSDEAHFLYDAAVKYHFLGNDISDTYLRLGEVPGLVDSEPVPVPSYWGREADITESLFGFNGTFGPVFDGGNRLVADLDLQLARYRRDATGYTGSMSLTPKYVFDLDNWHFSLGAKVSWLIYSEDYNLWPDTYRIKTGIIYPDAYVDFHLLDDRLILQASATGKDHFHTLSGRFYSRPFTGMNEYGHSRERFRAMIGARGNIASRFRYDLQGGYARWEHGVMDGFDGFAYESGYVLDVPALYEQSFNLLFADLDYGWKSESVSVDGRISWKRTNVKGDFVLAPAAWTGFIRPAYDWGGRLKAGLDAEWSTSRTACVDGKPLYRTPGWVDLGLFAEYRFTHRFGFWAKGGNLLNQAIQRTPLVAEAGMYFTAGILLNF